MPITPFVAPELFDRLTEYAKEVEQKKEASSPQPIDFCDNFYAQFFQNRMKKEINGFGKTAKESAIRLRLDVEGKEPQTVLLLITWFERYCDIRYDVFSEEYSGGAGDAVAEFHDYIEVLLLRIAAWAKVEQLSDIEQKANLELIEQKSNSALLDLQKALKTVSK